MNQNIIRWLIVVASFIIISLILWNTYVFFQYFKAEERAKMEIWSRAQKDLATIDSNTENINSVVSYIVTDINNKSPMIQVHKDGNYDSKNIDDDKIKDSIYRQKLILRFQNENKPIPLKSDNEVISTIYYGNSPLLNKLKYYPLALLLIIFLFTAVVYFFYRSSKNAAQNKLWTGMAKETAHQIGTPLSSLVGWVELLRSKNINPDYIKDIEKDINRLQTITDRFSKIGSVPKLEKADIIKETIESYDYLKTRSSKLINFEISAPNTQIYVNLNKQLFTWTIENLVKNAIDAMKGRGDLKIEIFQNDTHVKINIEDTGKGILKQQFSKIFNPGFTSKKRGWGLGLSLAKRIIEDYHNGKIKVLHSEINKGTTMQIYLKKL